MASKSSMGERSVPKPPNQGSAKPGGATVRQPEKGKNAQRGSGVGKMATKSIKAPGSGTSGQSGNRAGNSVPRA